MLLKNNFEGIGNIRKENISFRLNINRRYMERRGHGQCFSVNLPATRHYNVIGEFSQPVHGLFNRREYYYVVIIGRPGERVTTAYFLLGSAPIDSNVLRPTKSHWLYVKALKSSCSPFADQGMCGPQPITPFFAFAAINDTFTILVPG